MNGTAFTGLNTLTAQDAFGNTVTSFNSFGDNVTITRNAPLTGTVSGLHASNVLNNAADFVNGVADLGSLGMIYTGNAATGTFTATAQTAQTGTSNAIAINPGAATKLVLAGAPTQTAGTAQTLTITAQDASGNTATGYTGDKTLTLAGASAAGATPPTVTDKTGAAVALGTGATITFTNGVATAGGSLRLYKAESATITATDGTLTTTGSDRLPVTVGPATASSLDLSAATTTPTAGNADALTIRALDPWGNVATSYTGDKTLTFSGAASSPAPATAPTVTDKNVVARAFGTSETITFTNGVAAASLKLYKAETASVVVSDGTFSNGAGLSFTTAADTANKLAITVNGGSSPTAGVGFPVVLNSQDAYGNASNVIASTAVTLSLNTGTGTLGGTLSGSIGAGQSQATISGVTYSKAEAGVKLTATRTGGDALSPVTTPAFTVSALADRLVITAINGGSNPTAGTGFSVLVQAEDALGNPGNVSASTNLTLSLNTGTGTLGGTLTGTISAGSSSTTISGVTYTKAESGVKLTATRTSGDNLLASTSSPFTVDPGTATRFAIVGAGTQTAGSPNALTITAYDANGNVATGYTGDHGVTFSGASSIGANDPTVTDKTGAAQAFGTSTTLTFTNGMTTAGGSLVLRKVESALVVATAGSVTTSGADRLSVSVNPAATDHLTVTAGAAQTAGSAFNTVVTAKDQFGNLTPAYTGTVHFTSTDGSAGLPANYTFAAGDNGSHTFSTSLTTAGAQTITAADGSITGTTGTITVSPAATDHFAVSTNAGAPQTAGASFSTTVVAKDAFGNTTAGYTGTVTFTSSDGQAVLPRTTATSQATPAATSSRRR